MPLSIDACTMDQRRKGLEKSPLVLSGAVALFGYPGTRGEMDVLPRSLGWRRLRAAGFFLGGLALAPAVGMVPPHVPWALGALGLGGYLGYRKWREAFTVLMFRGVCPKCGGPLSIAKGTPVREVMSLPCSGCRHDSSMTVNIKSEGKVR